MSVPTTGSPIVAAFQRAQRNHTNIDAIAEPVATPTPFQLQPQQADTAQVATPTVRDLPLTRKPAHPCHNVLKISERIKIISWMKQESNAYGSKHIASKAVKRFSSLFRSSYKSNLQKTSRLWKTRSEYMNEDGSLQVRGVCSSITRSTYFGVKRTYLKARSGRGRKTRPWVKALHLDMLTEFDRLRKLGVKFNWKTLRSLALNLVEHSTSTYYYLNLRDDKQDIPISECITRRWIQHFTDRHRIVSRSITGKHLLSLAKEEMIHKEVAYHLGVMCRAFRSGELKEENVENADETHFVINLDNGKTLGFSGEAEVKYADVVSGGEGMTMLVRISGRHEAQIEAPFLVFQNKGRSYPIRGVPDDVPGVSYRTGPKGWMDTVVLPQWLSEPRAIGCHPHGRKRTIFVDNCSGHNPTREQIEAAKKLNTDIRFFPKNATHLVQPADSFIIQKIKSAWSSRWERHKMDLILRGEWSSSGKLCNPGKRFFLKLAVQAVRDVNHQRDSDGLTYARKAMIRTGMALNVNGLWEERQLFPELQGIIKKHRNHFDGEVVQM